MHITRQLPCGYYTTALQSGVVYWPCFRLSCLQGEKTAVKIMWYNNRFAVIIPQFFPFVLVPA